MKKCRKKKKSGLRASKRGIFVLIIILVCQALLQYYNKNSLIINFALYNKLSISEWPNELIELLQKNPDTKDFVLNYPLNKDLIQEINLSEYQDCDGVPKLYQWDERWGYTWYAGEMMAFSGCGPTCLSMVCIYLLNDTTYTPRYIADFAEKNG